MDPQQLADAGTAAVDVGTTIVQAAPAAKGIGSGFFNLDTILVPQNIALIVVSWSLTELISRSAKGWQFIRDHLLPILPLAFCELFVFATASWQPSATHGERALLGALLGTVTVWGHSFVQNSPFAKYIPFLKDQGADAAGGGSEKNDMDPKKGVDAGSSP